MKKNAGTPTGLFNKGRCRTCGGSLVRDDCCLNGCHLDHSLHNDIRLANAKLVARARCAARR